MALQFYFGGSGAGKSRKLHEDIIQAAMREPDRNFLLIVPDQFTMQTQMDLVVEHPNRGIMNIDVLSFGRLTHRILEEVGYEQKPVLDDTGKSLVLRKIAQGQELSVIGAYLNRIGYIHEVKSAISEFMQYGIGLPELEELMAYADKRGALYYKLQDLKIIYESFLGYIQERFITTEETLDRLREVLPQSKIIQNSVVAFDGFTGFTPIQNRVIQELMRLTKRVIITVTIDPKENPYQMDSEQRLFHLSKKTVYDMKKLAGEAECQVIDHIVCSKKINGQPPRFMENPELAHLEENLFRYPMKAYDKPVEKIRLMEASMLKEEIRQVCIEIRRLLQSGDIGELHYRDIAVVTGSMESYGDEIEEQFSKFDIPVYMDRTRGILCNPFTEYIRSALLIVKQDFSMEAVFHYLRTGLTGIERSNIDRLENYIRRFGIRGKKQWEKAFVYTEAQGEEGIMNLALYNRLREDILKQLAPLFTPCTNARELVHALYDFLVQNQLQQKLSYYEKYFMKEGEPAKAKEYGQIYALVIDLLDQIEGLLQEEPMEPTEFMEILDAGLAEITVGTIPQNVDRILIGDIERTRLRQVKVLFFVGVNDGNIPKNTGSGGILSDIDREFLQGCGKELAPTPRQQVYIQRLYLYLNMTKPSTLLYLSYAKVGNDGKSMRPAYLIGVMEKLFPALKVERPETAPMEEQLSCTADGIGFLTDLLREFAAGRLDDEKAEKAIAFYHWYKENPDYGGLTDKLLDTAFYQYKEHPLAKRVAKALYGSLLAGSISRLEKYASCAYAHFLQYGLSLKERGEYSFEQVDLGNVFHGVLELFSKQLEERHYTWFDFPKEAGEEILDTAIEAYAVTYGETILYSNARNQYVLKRIKRILARTVKTLQAQLRKGVFLPEHFELSFAGLESLDAIHISLGEQEKMQLQGRIDRVDTYVEDDTVYVKVIDYKSGNRRFDLAALYYGLQLQLVVYMNAAMELEQKKYPDKQIVPAAMLYYHIDDPLIEEGQDLSPEEIDQRFMQELKMTGIVNENDRIVRLMDGSFEGKSDILPVERKKDGTFSSRSSVINKENMELISRYVTHKIKELGASMRQGNIAVNPCEHGSVSACTYCAYKSVCGYDTEIPGYEMRKLAALTKDEALEEMGKALR